MSEKQDYCLKKALLKDIEKTVLDLTAIGIPKRKLDNLVRYLYNVDAKGVSRTVLTLQKRGGAQTHKYGIKGSALCGCIGGSKKGKDPLERCYAEENPESENSRNNGCPERSTNSSRCGSGRKKRSSSCGGGKCKWRHGRQPCSSGKCKSKRRSSSGGSKCVKKRKCRRAKKRKSGCAKKRKSRCAKKRKSRKRKGGSCGAGGCEMRHGRKPCSSGKCKSRRRSRSRGRCRGR